MGDLSWHTCTGLFNDLKWQDDSSQHNFMRRGKVSVGDVSQQIRCLSIIPMSDVLST